MKKNPVKTACHRTLSNEFSECLVNSKWNCTCIWGAG